MALGGWSSKATPVFCGVALLGRFAQRDADCDVYVAGHLNPLNTRVRDTRSLNFLDEGRMALDCFCRCFLLDLSEAEAPPKGEDGGSCSPEWAAKPQ